MNNYVTDDFRFNHLHFCPAEITMKEISIRTLLGELSRNSYAWCFANDAFREKLSSGQFELGKYVTKESPFDLVAYMQDDKVIVIEESVDSHLGTAHFGFRIFQMSFKMGNVAKIMLVGTEEEVPVPFAQT